MRRNKGKQPTIHPLPSRFISEEELELLTGIKRRTWQKHRLFRRGPRFYRLHGAVRYDLAEVMEWIRGNGVGGS
jgi:predicted DNA-binding transcriptional regulator AlpA